MVAALEIKVEAQNKQIACIRDMDAKTKAPPKII
jgi:hypothetical protein